MKTADDFPSISNSHEWPFTPGKKPAPVAPPGKTWPKISIVTPSFNQGPYIEKTIRSVLLQGYPNLEYFIIDGGSTDGSVDIIRKYEPWLDYWVSEKDRGQSHAINKGFMRASGELLGWLNSDDYYLPGALFKFAQAYLEDPSVGAIYGQGSKVNEKGEIVYSPELKPVTRERLFGWCFGNNFMQPSCLFTRNAWVACGPLDEEIHFAMDLDLWIRIADKFTFRKLNETLSLALAHSGAKTTADRSHMLVDTAMVYLKHGNHLAAKRVMDELADRLKDCESQLHFIRKFHFILGPAGRFFRLFGINKAR